jgi:glutamate racemase
MSMKIGFFDSGLGGLIVLREVVKVLPEYDYVYWGDTANLPYGDKTEEEVYELTKAAVTKLFERGCSIVVVACNTASSQTLRKLQDTFLKEKFPDKKVLGVIIPTLEELITINPERAILLATKRTVDSGKYELELKKLTNSLRLISLATSKLVPLIESEQYKEALSLASQNLSDVKVGEGDVVILGCTHYSLLKDELRHNFKNVTFLSQDEIIPYKLKDYLNHHPEIEQNLSRGGERTIHLTETREHYAELAGHFLKGAYVPQES